MSNRSSDACFSKHHKSWMQAQWQGFDEKWHMVISVQFFTTMLQRGKVRVSGRLGRTHSAHHLAGNCCPTQFHTLAHGPQSHKSASSIIGYFKNPYRSQEVQEKADGYWLNMLSWNFIALLRLKSINTGMYRDLGLARDINGKLWIKYID